MILTTRVTSLALPAAAASLSIFVSDSGGGGGVAAAAGLSSLSTAPPGSQSGGAGFAGGGGGGSGGCGGCEEGWVKDFAGSEESKRITVRVLFRLRKMCEEDGLPWPWVLEVAVSGGAATLGELTEEGGCCGGGGGVDALFGVGVALRSFVHISATHFSQGRADYQTRKLQVKGTWSWSGIMENLL